MAYWPNIEHVSNGIWCHKALALEKEKEQESVDANWD